jgi:concanavalin A-like lectin/glucanase superfamily protein
MIKMQKLQLMIFGLAVIAIGIAVFYSNSSLQINPLADMSTSSLGTTTSSSVSATSSYNQIVLADHPVAFWNVDPKNKSEVDLSGNGNTGTYENGLPAMTTMPDGDTAADFNGTSQYLTIPSNISFSIPTTGNLTWEAWIRPDTLQFPNGTSDSYVEFIGKCAHHSPTCEWQGRMYDEMTLQAGRSSRISAYVYNPTAGLGSGADWQPTNDLFHTGQWIQVVGEYTTHTQPSDCPDTSAYPGSINIWVDGVKWNQSYHSSTGCMSQYKIKPQTENSPLNIGTLSLSTWFKGAIGKVAIYNYLLSQSQINNHYKTMTGLSPSGHCLATCTF